jgi:hypothetical protein
MNEPRSKAPLGRAIAVALAREGANSALLDIDDEASLTESIRQYQSSRYGKPPANQDSPPCRTSGGPLHPYA